MPRSPCPKLWEVAVAKHMQVCCDEAIVRLAESFGSVTWSDRVGCNRKL